MAGQVKSRRRSALSATTGEAAADRGDSFDCRQSPEIGKGDGAWVVSDLPSALCPTKAEIALLRAFLAEEIEAILRDGE